MVEDTSKKMWGWLSIAVEVDCPKCHDVVDLMKIPSMRDGDLLLNQILSAHGWGCDDLDQKVACPNCGEDFVVGRIVW